MSASQLSALCALLPALAPDIAAELIGELLAAVPRLPVPHDPAERERVLVRRLAGMGPRDPEEAMLAVQAVIAYFGATLCTQAAEALDPAGKEASRLRRDAAVQQRALVALLRALLRARARPMLADPETGEARPAVLPAAAPATQFGLKNNAVCGVTLPAPKSISATVRSPFPAMPRSYCTRSLSV